MNREHLYIFFSDDDKYDLKTMYEREKLSTAEDQNGMLSRYGRNFIFLPTLIYNEGMDLCTPEAIEAWCDCHCCTLKIHYKGFGRWA